MQAKFVRHVCDLIALVCLLRDHLHVAILRVIEVDGRPRVACLGEAALEDFHDAVGVGMAVACQ